jgi:uncharacterized protein YbjT (DUF2867 family)
MSNILVIGASGYIGTHLVPELQRQGHHVRATARHPKVLEGRNWSGVEYAKADVLDPETLDSALQGMDIAYYLVHSMAAGKHFDELDNQAASNFAAAAARSGLKRIIYLGGLVPEQPASKHIQSRKQTGDLLRQGPVPVTEIRAGMIIGPGSAAWEIIRDLVNHLPIMVTPRWVLSRSQPIALPNLLGYLVGIARLPETEGLIYDAPGPEILTYETMMRQYGELVHKSPWIFRVPLLTPRLSSYWLRLVTSVPVNIARALIEGMEHDFISKGVTLAEVVPQHLLNFRESAQAALAADREHKVVARWVEGAIACREFHSEYSYYAKRSSGHRVTRATSEQLWTAICHIGGKHDYFYADGLWFIRRALDWIVGGPSFRRPRRNPAEFQVGDLVDAWRVIGLEPSRRLTLQMEMKAPGAGVLELNIEDLGKKRRITASAYFHPAGLPGLMYWYLLLPLHNLLFKGMTRNIAKLALQNDAPED